MRSLLERAQADQQTEALDGATIKRSQQIVRSLKHHVDIADRALDQLASDPGKYAPQIDNVEHALRSVEREIKGLRRRLGIK